jgi:gliding motility-associated-like protein
MMKRSASKTARLLILIYILLSNGASVLLCQNLVPNPSFEEYDECPYDGDSDGPMPCIPWISSYSCNYFNVCFPGFYGVPENFKGFQQAHTGEAYIGAYQQSENNGNTEFPQVELLEELVEGQCYQVSFYTSLANEGCGINWLGVALTHEIGGWPGYYPTQIDIEYLYYSDTSQWMPFVGTMIAMGGERFLTLGNFHEEEETEIDPLCFPPNQSAYYYFDDVAVEAVETFPIAVDLGGPYTSCFPVILDPQISGATYLWSDGSTGPVLQVTESGTYTVVVTTGPCTGGVASAEVTILESFTADLGPDVTLCQGDAFTINLDPTLGTYEWQDGSTSSSYTISAPGTYSITMDDGCQISTDAIVVTGLTIPYFDLGSDDILCAGDDLWYSFSSTLGDFVWQDGSTHPYFHVEEAGSYALTVTNMCGSYSDEITFTFDEPPVFDLGSFEQFLCADSLLIFDIDETLGNILWQDGSTTSQYVIVSPGEYAVTISNTCGTITDAVDIYTIDPIFIDLDVIPENPCPGEVFTIDLSHNSGEFLWNTGSISPIIQITSSGLYAVTATNECGQVTDEVMVEYMPEIYPPNLGHDTLICDGGSLTLSVPQTGASVIWSDMSQGNSLVVSTSGEYAVTISTPCETYADTIQIFFELGAPTISLPEQINLCEGEAIIIDPDVPHGNFAWSDGSTLSSLTVTTPGIYSVTVINECGTAADTVHVVSVGSAPLVSLGADTSICPGGSIVLTPEFLNVDQWQWPDGSSDSMFMISAAGQVVLQVSNSCGTNSDTINVLVSPALPAFDIGPDTLICEGESVTLELSIADVDLLWPDGSDQTTFTTADSGWVIVMVTNACASRSDTMTIEWHPPLPSLELGADLLLCPGESITIEPGILNVLYTWHDGSSQPHFIATLPGTIALTISDECESASDSIHVIESNLSPQVDLGPDVRVCEGETVTLFSGVSGVQYLWQDGSTGSSYEADSSGLYHLTVSNSCGMDVDSIEVTISGTAPLTSLGPDTSLCIGQSILLQGQQHHEITHHWQDGSSGASYLVTTSGEYILTEANFCGSDSDTIHITIDGVPPGVMIGNDTTLCAGSSLLLQPPIVPNASYQWQDSSLNPEYLVTMPGTYALLISNQCGQGYDEIVVDFMTAPTPFDFGPDTTVCQSEQLWLQAPDDGIDYLWQDGSTASTYLVNTTGVYSVTVSNLCGQSSDSILIQVKNDSLLVPSESILPLCDDESILLEATQIFPAQYSWSTGDTESFIQISTPGTYTVSIITDCSSASFPFEIIPDPACKDTGFAFPNVFSPNGDHINDIAQLSTAFGLELLASEGYIYDRWGGLVFSSTAIPFEWNGKMQEEGVLPGVYVYMIRIKYNSGETEQTMVLTGDITVIR